MVGPLKGFESERPKKLTLPYLSPSIILDLIWGINSQLQQSISFQLINLQNSFICFKSLHSSFLRHTSLTDNHSFHSECHLGCLMFSTFFWIPSGMVWLVFGSPLNLVCIYFPTQNSISKIYVISISANCRYVSKY